MTEERFRRLCDAGFDPLRPGDYAGSEERFRPVDLCRIVDGYREHVYHENAQPGDPCFCGNHHLDPNSYWPWNGPKREVPA